MCFHDHVSLFISLRIKTGKANHLAGFYLLKEIVRNLQILLFVGFTDFDGFLFHFRFRLGLRTHGDVR